MAHKMGEAWAHLSKKIKHEAVRPRKNFTKKSPQARCLGAITLDLGESFDKDRHHQNGGDPLNPERGCIGVITVRGIY